MSTGLITVEYKPHPQQVEFLRQCRKHRFVLFVGGRQVGKGKAGSLQCWIEMAKTGEDEPDRNGVILAPTYAMSEVACHDFEAVCPEGILGIKKDNSGRKTYTIANGWTVDVGSAEEPDRQRGRRNRWFWMDEAAMMPKYMFEVMLPTLLRWRGRGWATTTPRGRNWIYTDWYLKTVPGLPGCDLDYGAVRARSVDNWYLPAEDVERFRSKFSGSLASQEIDGEFIGYEGLVYRDFDPGLHVTEAWSPNDAQIKRVICGIDFGVNDPFVCLWLAQKDGRWQVCDEYYAAGKTTDYHAPSLLDNPWQKRVEIAFADHDADSIATLRRFGLTVAPARKHERSVGIDELKRLLALKLSDGRPALTVAAHCTETIREFGKYRYPEATDKKNSGDKPLGKDDHAMDALRYALYSEGFTLYHGRPGPPREGPPGPGTYGWLKAQIADRQEMRMWTPLQRSEPEYIGI